MVNRLSLYKPIVPQLDSFNFALLQKPTHMALGNPYSFTRLLGSQEPLNALFHKAIIRYKALSSKGG
jgi:hypothetical protein